MNIENRVRHALSARLSNSDAPSEVWASILRRIERQERIHATRVRVVTSLLALALSVFTIAGLEGALLLDENLEVVRRTGHSRFPYTRTGDLDHVEGVMLVTFAAATLKLPDTTGTQLPTLDQITKASDLITKGWATAVGVTVQ